MTVPIEHLPRIMRGGYWVKPDSYLAMPQAARAATPSGPSLLRVSGIAGIAIAVFLALYFAWQFAGRPGL